MEIEKLIQESYTELVEDSEFINRLKDKIKTEIEKNITSAITSYEVGRKIEKEFQSTFGKLIDGLDFSQYNILMSEKVNEIAKEIYGREFADKVSASFERQFLAKPPEKISLYDLFLKLIQLSLYGRNDTILSRHTDDEFLFAINRDRVINNSDFIDIRFKPEKDADLEYQITIYRGYQDVYKVLSLTKNGSSFFRTFVPHAGNELEEFLGSLLLSESEILVEKSDIDSIPTYRSYSDYEEYFEED